VECPYSRPSVASDRSLCSQCGLSFQHMPPIDCPHDTQRGDAFCPVCERASTTPNCLHVSRNGNNQLSFAVGEAERRVITVLFADAVNYTSLADRLDPEDVYQIVGDSFRRLYEVVHSFEGIVTHFAGDGIMVLFGAPIAQEDHAERACRAALSMQEAMGTRRTATHDKYGVGFSIRIGINSGLAVVGTLGQGYTALGDTVNVASRLQSLGDAGSITISKETRSLVHHHFDFEEIGAARLKGKQRETHAYRLLGIKGPGKSGLPDAERAGFFVGRKSELAQLGDLFIKTKGGKGQIAAIVGEAGVGKSTIVSHFIQSLSSEDYTFLEGECLHFGSPIAYLPIREAFRHMLGVDEGYQETAIKAQIVSIVARLGLDASLTIPPLCELTSLNVDDEMYLQMEPQEKQSRTFIAFRDLLVKESSRLPIVLVVENLSWIDKSSESLLSFLIPAISASRVMLVLVYRPDYVPPWEGESVDITRVTLAGLQPSECPGMLEFLLEGHRASTEIIHFVVNRSKGNPFFIEELTRSLVESGYVRKGGEGYELSRRLLEVALPDSVQDIVSARIDRLGTSAKRTLQRAAVVGKTFTVSLLERIAGSEELSADLIQLRVGDFITPHEDNNDSTYEFRHDLIQEVAYNRMLIRQRKGLHEAVARAVEEIQAENTHEASEVLAYHYSKSENTRKACFYLQLSGDRMVSRSSLWEGFNYYKGALDMLKRESPSHRRFQEELEVHQKMVPAMISLGFPDNSLDLLREGEALARDSGSARLIVTFKSLIGLYCSVRGHLTEGQKYTEECLKIAEDSGDVDLIASTAFDACSNYSARGAFLNVRRVASRVTKLIEEQGREKESFHRGYNIYTALLGFWGFSEAYLGCFSEGEGLCIRGIHYAEPTGNLPSLGLLETCYGYVLAHRGRGEASMPHFEKAMEYLEKGNVSVLQGLARAGLGWAHFFAGNFQIGEGHVKEGLTIHSQAGIHYKSSIPFWFLAQMYLENGRIDDAEHYARSALDHAKTNNEAYLEGIALVLIGSCDTARKRFHRGEKYLVEGLRMLEDRAIKTYLGVGNLYLAEHYEKRAMKKKARIATQNAYSIFVDTGMWYWLSRLLKSFPSATL
jgi:class 3 adenylate cyclase/tetratricopeptide (TPR) repeat protein